MDNKVIFLNTGWMDFYKGITGDSDTITGGGKHVDKEGWGGEMFNFKSFGTKVYGYVQPKIDRINNTESTIRLEKIGALKTRMNIESYVADITAEYYNLIHQTIRINIKINKCLLKICIWY